VKDGESALKDLAHFLNKSFPHIQLGEFNENELLVIVSVKVRPNVRKERIELGNETTLIVSIMDPPVDGRANKKLIEVLSAFFGISKSHIEIEKGEKSKIKKFILYFSTSQKKSNDYIKKIILSLADVI